MLGTIGILATTTYFTLDGFSFLGVFLPFGSGEIEEGLDPWQVALSFVAAGLADRRARARRRPHHRAPAPLSHTYNQGMKIGVLAVQGNFREHVAMLRELGADVVEVRLPEQLDGLDGLVIPGGESTAITRLMRLYGLEEAIRSFAEPVFGTCAGMILLDRAHLGLVDVDVERNGYGRQVASFEADLALAGEAEPLRGVFIRAPRVTDAGPEVEVLASHDGSPVLLRARAGSSSPRSTRS